MEDFIVYLGKGAIVAGLFYIVYLGLFQSRKQFTFNRIYLPASLMLSFVIPLITITTVRYVESVPHYNINSSAFVANGTGIVDAGAFALEWYHYLLGLYVLGVVFFMLHFLFGYFKALSIVRSGENHRVFNTTVCITKEDIHPFSFFNKIVISKNTLDHPDLEMIVNHENIHVEGKHTNDILLTEFMFIAQWFNPFAWLIKDAVKNNLEYITDNKVVQNHNPKNYQMAMLTLADKQGVAPFLTALNGSQLKNRIIMMKKKTENKYALVKQLVVLPLLAILVMGLSNKEVKTEVVKSTHGFSIADSTINDVEVIAYGRKNSTTEDTVINIETGVRLLANPGNSNPPLYVVNGREVDDIESILPEDIESISVLKGESGIELYGEKGKNGVILIALKDADWVETSKKEKPLDEDIVVTAIGIKKSTTGDTVTLSGNVRIHSNLGNSNSPLFIVDGKLVDDINGIDPSQIEKVSVLKGETATELYGEKGKNGVIKVTTKKAEEDKFITTISELHRALAMNLKYPVEAQKKSIEGKVTLYATVDNKAHVTGISVEPTSANLVLDEIVITARKNNNIEPTQNNESKLLINEVTEVFVRKMPLIQIPEFKGKIVAIPVKFVLQE